MLVREFAIASATLSPHKLSGWAIRDRQMALQAGDKAPNFKLESDAGLVSRTSLKGKPFIVYFYPKDDTSGCTKEALAFSAAAKKFEKLGIFVLGVSKD